MMEVSGGGGGEPDLGHQHDGRFASSEDSFHRSQIDGRLARAGDSVEKSDGELAFGGSGAYLRERFFLFSSEFEIVNGAWLHRGAFETSRFFDDLEQTTLEESL